MRSRKGSYSNRGSFRKSMDYMDNSRFDQTGKPAGDNKPDIAIAIKAMRGLPASSYSVLADPYDAALPTSKPYPPLAPFNKTVGGVYKGLKNIDGGNVTQYANAVTSKFLKYFDFSSKDIKLNYRYIPAKYPKGFSSDEVTVSGTSPQEYIERGHYTGRELIDEMRRAISEAYSILKSTTFTQLDINDYYVITDMPMGSAHYTKDSDGNKIYTNPVDVFFAVLIQYQRYLQDWVNVFNYHNAFRMKMGTMVRSSWNRETPNLNSFFGLMKKKSFLSLLDSMSLAFEGEFMDTQFMEQTNLLTLIPSRRSNSITDPVLEVVPTYSQPSIFKMGIEDIDGTRTEVFDQEVDFVINVNGTPIHNDAAIASVTEYLSATDTMSWARNSTVGDNTDNGRFNDIKKMFDVINQCFTRFKTQWADVRECLETLVRAGIVKWTKTFRPTITKDTDAGMFRNLLIDDIYRICGSSADKIKLDPDTKRWRLFSLWNMYDGIPEYDTYQGGAFLTFSLKEIDDSNDPDNLIDYLPIAFIDPNQQARFVSRDGVDVDVDLKNTIVMDDDSVLSRLVPLASQAGLTTRVPKLAYDASIDTAHRSTMYKTLTQVFGLAQVQMTSGATDVSLDPDILAVYQIEVEDITNEAITYARANGPFKGTVASPSVIGLN